MTTFAVDPVEEALAPPTTKPLQEGLEGVRWFAPGPETRVLASTHAHPLLEAVHCAFSEHRPLVLSPDVVWLTIAQGFTQHIRLNAETFRSRLVRHEGRKKL